MFRIAFLTLALLLFASQSTRADVIEDFSYPLQSDNTGFGDPGDLIYRITTTGTFGGTNDHFIATFSEDFAASAGIAFESGNSFATFGTSSASGLAPLQTTFLGVADFPGFGDTQPAGPFATFFDTPQDLQNAIGSVDLRIGSGVGDAYFRMLALDDDDNEVVTNLFQLSDTFTTYYFNSGDFDSSQPFDATRVVMLGIDFFADSDALGNLPAFQFHVDNLYVAIIPEPSSGLVLIAAIGLLVTRRRARGSWA